MRHQQRRFYWTSAACRQLQRFFARDPDDDEILYTLFKSPIVRDIPVGQLDDLWQQSQTQQGRERAWL